MRFDTLWKLTSSVSGIDGNATSDNGTIGIRTISHEENWETRTDFTFFSLDRIVLADFSRPLVLRLWRYLVAFTDFVTSGVAWRFFARAWRFALYFLYPFAVLSACVALGCLVAVTMWGRFGLAGSIAGILLSALAFNIVSTRWSIGHLMDLWSFSLEHLRGQRPEAEALMVRFAETIRERVAADRYDEVLLVGHSTGGMIMLEVASLVAKLDGGWGQRDADIVLLTLGSTALKAGYHPAAHRFRQSVQSIVDDKRIQWVEIQCLTDVINFYKTNPVTEMNIQSARSEPFPLVRTVRIRSMVQPEAYRRIRRRLFRLHYQYVFANTKLYWYDFFQIICGPIFLDDRIRQVIVGSRPVQTQAPPS